MKALKQLVNKKFISMLIGLLLISTNGFASDYCQERAKKDRAYFSGMRADYDKVYPTWTKEERDLKYRKDYAEIDASIRYDYERCTSDEERWKDPVYVKRLKEKGNQDEKDLIDQITKSVSKQDES